MKVQLPRMPPTQRVEQLLLLVKVLTQKDKAAEQKQVLLTQRDTELLRPKIRHTQKVPLHRQMARIATRKDMIQERMEQMHTQRVIYVLRGIIIATQVATQLKLVPQTRQLSASLIEREIQLYLK